MKILFFDTETTGLPKNWKAPVHQLDNWPRLVQIAWQVYNSNGDLLEEHEYVIKPLGFIIPSEASAVHKITTQKALKIGQDLLTILKVFKSSVKDCGLLVAHNYNYDYNVMGSELLRNGLENSLKDKDHICTMNASTNFCKISGPYGYKWPKLEELYKILFDESFNAHNALDDIRATARCFWELISLNLVETINPEIILNTNLTEEKVIDSINKSFEKCQIKSLRKFTLKDYKILTDIDSSSSSSEWIKMYKQSLKIRLYPGDDRGKFILRDLEITAQHYDVYSDPEVPGNDSYYVDFQDPWEEQFFSSNSEMDYDKIDLNEIGISPFATSTVVLKRDSDGKTEIEINYYKGQEICKKQFSNGILVYYLEYDLNPFQIRVRKTYDNKGKLISTYNIFDENNKLSYYARFGDKGSITSIQIFKNGRIQSIIRYDKLYNIKHLGSYTQHRDYPLLNYIEDIRYHDSSLGYIKTTYIFKDSELVIKYFESKIENKIWHSTTCSKKFQQRGYSHGNLEGINNNQRKILAEILSQNCSSNLICFYIPNKDFPNCMLYHLDGKIKISSLIDL